MFVLRFHHGSRWLHATILAAALLGVSAEHGRCDSAQFHLGGKPVDGSKVWSIEPVETRELRPPPEANLQEVRPAEPSENENPPPEIIREAIPENDLRPHGNSGSQLNEQDTEVYNRANELVLPPYRVVIVQPPAAPAATSAPAPAAEPPALLRSAATRGDSHSSTGQNVSMLAAGFSVGVLLTVSLILLPLIVLLWRAPAPGRNSREPLSAAESRSQAATAMSSFGTAEDRVVGRAASDNPPHILPFESLTTTFAEQRDGEKRREEQRTAAIVKAIRDETIALQQRLRESRSAA